MKFFCLLFFEKIESSKNNSALLDGRVEGKQSRKEIKYRLEKKGEKGEVLLPTFLSRKVGGIYES